MPLTIVEDGPAPSALVRPEVTTGHATEEYNRSDSAGLALLELALAAFPAGQIFAGTLHELSTNERLRALAANIRNLQRIASASGRAHNALERVEEVVKKGKNVTDLVEKTHAVSRGGGAKKRGDFAIATIATLADLLTDEVANRWQNEDFIAAMLQSMEYSSSEIDLRKNVGDVLGPMPAADQVKAKTSTLAVNFELRLYLQYYVEPGKVTQEIEDQDGALRVSFHGVPRSVIRRFDELGKIDMFVNHKKMKTVRRKTYWHGHQV